MKSAGFGELERVGLSDMFQTALGEWFATWWWVILVVVVLWILNLVSAKPRYRRRRVSR